MATDIKEQGKQTPHEAQNKQKNNGTESKKNLTSSKKNMPLADDKKLAQLRAKLRRQEARRKLRELVIAREIMIGENGALPKGLHEVVAFDLECAGYVEDDIIEIGAVRINLDDDSAPIAYFHELVHPRTRLNKYVTQMTGITMQDLAGKDTIDKVMPRFIMFVGNAPVLGHSIGDNDIVRINLAIRRARIKGIKNFLPRYIDTEKIAHRIFDGKEPEIKKFGLTALLAHYGIEIEDSHRATDDAISAYRLYKKLVEEIKSQAEK